MGVDEVPDIESPLSKTSEYPDHVHVPAFRNRQVLVKVALGAKIDPSGIDTSRTNWAWSQTGVGEEARVEVGRARVGKLTEVLVAAGGGRVGVTNGVSRLPVGVACVDIAWTVSAAAVKTAFGSSVAGEFEGRLQAVRIRIKMNKIETGRAIFNILFSSVGTILHPSRFMRNVFCGGRGSGIQTADVYPLFLRKGLAMVSFKGRPLSL
jgi:hypothetical protein